MLHRFMLHRSGDLVSTEWIGRDSRAFPSCSTRRFPPRFSLLPFTIAFGSHPSRGKHDATSHISYLDQGERRRRRGGGGRDEGRRARPWS